MDPPKLTAVQLSRMVYGNRRALLATPRFDYLPQGEWRARFSHRTSGNCRPPGNRGLQSAPLSGTPTGGAGENLSGRLSAASVPQLRDDFPTGDGRMQRKQGWVDLYWSLRCRIARPGDHRGCKVTSVSC